MFSFSGTPVDLTFENWQIAQFRILGNDKYAPYGTSVLEPCRRIWRQLTLLEDAMMAYRSCKIPRTSRFFILMLAVFPKKKSNNICNVLLLK